MIFVFPQQYDADILHNQCKATTNYDEQEKVIDGSDEQWRSLARLRRGNMHTTATDIDKIGTECVMEDMGGTYSLAETETMPLDSMPGSAAGSISGLSMVFLRIKNNVLAIVEFRYFLIN